jgi:hypothetical protein
LGFRVLDGLDAADAVDAADGAERLTLVAAALAGVVFRAVPALDPFLPFPFLPLADV